MSYNIIIFCDCNDKFRAGITFNFGTRSLYVSYLIRPVAHSEGFCPEWQPRAIEQQGCSEVGLPVLEAWLHLYCLFQFSKLFNLFISQFLPL